MEILLYPIIVFLATALGATSGAGGGAIIKPVFDGIGIDSASVIGIYSTVVAILVIVIVETTYIANVIITGHTVGIVVIAIGY